MSNIQEVNMFAVTPAIEQEWEQQALNIKETRTKEEAVEYLEYERTVARVKRAFLLSDGYVTGAGAISSECYEKYINYLTALIQSKETEQDKNIDAHMIVPQYIEHLVVSHKIDNAQNKQALVPLNDIALSIEADEVCISCKLFRMFKDKDGEQFKEWKIQKAVTLANKQRASRKNGLTNSITEAKE